MSFHVTVRYAPYCVKSRRDGRGVSSNVAIRNLPDQQYRELMKKLPMRRGRGGQQEGLISLPILINTNYISGTIQFDEATEEVTAILAVEKDLISSLVSDISNNFQDVPQNTWRNAESLRELAQNMANSTHDYALRFRLISMTLLPVEY